MNEDTAISRRVSAERLDVAFAAEDHAAIQAAVRDVEAQSPGEIVPYAVDRSDSYREAAWITATLGALLVGLITALMIGTRVLDGGLGDAVFWIGGPPTIGAALGYL